MRILVGTPTITPDKRFLDSLSSFLFEASKKYDITHKFIYKKPIYEAQNLLAFEAIEHGYDYLLMVEDDHWGFTVEHLDKLIALNHPFCAFPYYSRHFPYMLTAMKFEGINARGTHNYSEIKHNFGIHPADLVGFGFTLFAAELLKKIPTPIFYPLHDQARATDQWFCHNLWMNYSMKPLVCFDDIIPHRDITKDTVNELRNIRLNDKSLFAFNVWAYKKRHSPGYLKDQELRKQKALELCNHI